MNNNIDANRIPTEELKNISGGVLTRRDERNYYKKIDECIGKGWSYKKILSYFTDGLEGTDKEMVTSWVMLRCILKRIDIFS